VVRTTVVPVVVRKILCDKVTDNHQRIQGEKNATLYAIVAMHDIVGTLESVGLDPAVGFLHRIGPARQKLALGLN